MTDRTLPTAGADKVLQATYEADPHAVRQAVLRAYQAAGGDADRAAAELDLEPFVLAEWVRRLELEQLIQERWPG